jgi:hypothetical protein
MKSNQVNASTTTFKLGGLKHEGTFNITVKKTGLAISGCTIEAWNTGTGGSGDATMPL